MKKETSSDVSDLETDLSMDGRTYLSRVLDVTAFKRGQANVIIAPCHSGKTTAALTKMTALASCPEKVLMLIDTTAGKESLLKRKETRKYSDRWQQEIRWIENGERWGELESGNGIRVMTYHQLGYQLEMYPDLLSQLDVLICDEMHNLLTYKNIEQAHNKNRNKTGEAVSTVCKRAWREIIRASNTTENTPLVLIMTATVNALTLALDKDHIRTEFFDFTDKVTRDISKHTIYYHDIKAVLNQLDDLERAIIYIQQVSQMKEIAQAAENGWRNICCLWSLHNGKHEMTAEQLEVRNALLGSKRIPDSVDLLFINAAYETSINIENTDFQTMIIHSGNPDTRIQVRGRLRHNINTLYLYDTDHENITSYFPEKYYNKFLTSSDTDEIVALLDLRDKKGRQKKWPTILKSLERDGVEVIKLKQKGIRGCILRKVS